MNVRKCTIQDLPWLIDVAVQKFGDFIKDVPATMQWFQQILMTENVAVFKTDEAYVVVGYMRQFFDPETVLAIAEYSAGNIWHWPALLKSAAEWAQGFGAKELIFKPTTGISPEAVAAIAARAGMVVDNPTYKMEIK